MSESVLGSERIDKGRPFQIEGPATAKARFCLVEVRANGTRRRPRSADRRGRELRALCVEPQNSTRVITQYQQWLLSIVSYGPLWRQWLARCLSIEILKILK